MVSKKKKHIAIIFGKEENNSFNRYTFPIHGRPVALYPLLAALYASKIDSVYLSSDSSSLLNIGKNLKDVKLLERKISQPTLTEEVRLAVNQVVKDLDYIPDTVTLLLANSPCVVATNIDDAITFLENNDDYNSVATAMKRPEFNPTRIYYLNKQNDLVRTDRIELNPYEIYFLDRRVMVARTEILLNSTINNNDFEGILGTKIHPIIQQEGLWDIDYVWQVPIVERWLRQNGFNDTETAYDKNKEKISAAIQLKEKVEITYKTKNKFKILITTIPFGEIDLTPLKLLDQTPNIEYVINPIGRKLKESELIELVKDFDIIIAGTEPITRKVMESGTKLKLISRVGIGLDSVDLHAAKELGISVSYTPDSPAPAVAELTIGHMLNMLRRTPLVDRKLRSGIWQRIHGERLTNCIIGVIGTGRVGSRVLRHLQGFNPKKILVNDLRPDYNLYEMCHAEFVDKEIIYSEADIITIHVPLTPLTLDLLNKNNIALMKTNVCLINTSRGGIINERDLYEALSVKRISAAAIDVFQNEPYLGNLIELDNCFLSCHMGSMTNDCRAQMEILATEEACRFVKNEPLQLLVPEEEYNLIFAK